MKKLERSICVYSNKTEEYLFEVSVDEIPLDVLKTIVTPEAGDTMLIEAYPIDAAAAELLQKHVACDFDFSKNSYFLECVTG